MEAYEGALERAERAGMTARQIEIVMDMSLALLWFDQERGEKLVERAVALAQPKADTAIHGFALGVGTFWSVAADGPLAVPQGDPRDELRTALQALRAGGNQERLALLLTVYAAILGLSSDYRASVRIADDALAFARETAAPLEAIVGEWFRAWALIYLGEWGQALRGLSEAIARAKRDGLAVWASVLEMEWPGCTSRRSTSPERTRFASTASPARSRTGSFRCSSAAWRSSGWRSVVWPPRRRPRGIPAPAQWQSGRRLLMDWFWCMPVNWGHGRDRAGGGS